MLSRRSLLKQLGLVLPGIYYGTDGSLGAFVQSAKLQARIEKGDFPTQTELHQQRRTSNPSQSPAKWWSGAGYSYVWNRMAAECLSSRDHINKIIDEIARFGGEKNQKVQKKILLGLYMILSFGVPKMSTFVTSPESNKLKQLYGVINRNNNLAPDLKNELIEELGHLNKLGGEQLRTTTTYLALHALSSLAFGMCTARLYRDGRYRESLEAALREKINSLKEQFESQHVVEFEPSEYLPIDIKNLIPESFSPDQLGNQNKKIVLEYTPRQDYKISYIGDIDKLNLINIASNIIINIQDLLNPSSSKEEYLYTKPLKSDILYLSATDLKDRMRTGAREMSDQQAKEDAGLFFRSGNVLIPLKYLDTRRIENLKLTLVQDSKDYHNKRGDPPVVYLDPDFKGTGMSRRTPKLVTTSA